MERLIQPEDFFPAKITTLSRLQQVCEKIMGHLPDLMKRRFKESCFGHFLDVGDSQFSCKLVHHFMLRQLKSPTTKREMFFRIGEAEIHWSKKEFALITGLRCGKYPQLDADALLRKGNPRLTEYFNGRPLNNCALESVFETTEWSDNNEDGLKMALLYFLEAVLLSKPKKTSINHVFFALVDDIEQFNNFPWGRICFRKTIDSMKSVSMIQKAKSYMRYKALKEASDISESYTLFGFPYAFQVFAYESIPALTSFTSRSMQPHAYPRMLRWRSKIAYAFKTYQKSIFGNSQLVVQKMMPDQQELQQPYYISFGSAEVQVTPEDEQQVAHSRAGCRGLEDPDGMPAPILVQEVCRDAELAPPLAKRLRASSQNSPPTADTEVPPSALIIQREQVREEVRVEVREELKEEFGMIRHELQLIREAQAEANERIVGQNVELHQVKSECKAQFQEIMRELQALRVAQGDSGPSKNDSTKNGSFLLSRDIMSEDVLIRRAEMYQEYMKNIPIPTRRGSLIPFTSWQGLGTSLKPLYCQPLHYLTNTLLKQWDMERIGSETEHQELDSIVHPVKAEAIIWVIEEKHRLTTSPHHLAKLWASDPFYAGYIDSIVPSV